MTARRQPIVALSMRIMQAPGHHEQRDAISHDWMKRLEAWGMVPVLIPNALADPAAYLDRLMPDLLVLTGGDDIGATPTRDAAETAMLGHALKGDLPVLGVCRGMQVINTRLGGALTHVDNHVGKSHYISVSPPWQGLYGDRIMVNSYHAYGVAAGGLAKDLMVTATDGGDHVEACCHRGKAVAAVMWHPERDPAPEGDRLLIIRLIEDGAFWT